MGCRPWGVTITPCNPGMHAVQVSPAHNQFGSLAGSTGCHFPRGR